MYLGGAETVLGISDKFKAIPGQRGVYGVNRPVDVPSLGMA
jgi:chemotaxis protein methyltransferase CheR